MVSFLREEELRYPVLLKNVEKMFPMAMSKQVSKLLLGYWVSTRPSVLAEFSVKLGKESTLVTSDIVLGTISVYHSLILIPNSSALWTNFSSTCVEIFPALLIVFVSPVLRTTEWFCLKSSLSDHR